MLNDIKEIYKFGLWIPFLFITAIILKLVFFSQSKYKTQEASKLFVEEATPTAENKNVYSEEEENLISNPTEKQIEDLSLNRCTNDIYSFTLLYPNEVVSLFASEADRCTNFAYLENETIQENPTIKLLIDEAEINDLAENNTASLHDIKIEEFNVDNGYTSLIIQGTWPAESVNSGVKYLSILVENQDKYVLVFEVKQELTGNEFNTFKKIAKSIRFL